MVTLRNAATQSTNAARERPACVLIRVEATTTEASAKSVAITRPAASGAERSQGRPRRNQRRPAHHPRRAIQGTSQPIGGSATATSPMVTQRRRYCGFMKPRRRRSFSTIALRYSRLSSPITLIEISCGHAYSHSPWFVQPPNPSSSCCRTMLRAL